MAIDSCRPRGETARHPALARITTPLLARAWRVALSTHPDTRFTAYILDGIVHGFRVGFARPSSLRSATRNCPSAEAHPQVVTDYIAKEVSLGRFLGPFSITDALPLTHLSKFAVIPKGHTPGKWRLITDLSSPKGQSVNDALSPPICSLHYVTVDEIATVAGEITTLSLTAFDPTVHLSWGDVAVDDPIRPKSIRIHLKRSKCDQFRAGVDIHLGRTTSPLCPVTAVLAYMASRQDTPGPFFRDRRGRPLTKATFVQKVRHALSQLGLPAEQFAGHSFRIGAATAAAKVGLEDSVIQAQGRWSSAAFLLYIRTPREHLTQFTARLASQPQASP